jgi:hypothetical protein
MNLEFLWDVPNFESWLKTVRDNLLSYSFANGNVFHVDKSF